MRIGELAAATGVDSETIRYYEREGLLNTPTRQLNGYRTYGRPQLERLSFIRHCRALDIPLADIRQLIAILDGPGEDCGQVDHLIDAQLARVQARLQSMRALKRQLTELRKRCAAPPGLAAIAAFCRNWLRRRMARPVSATVRLKRRRILLD